MSFPLLRNGDFVKITGVVSSVQGKMEKITLSEISELKIVQPCLNIDDIVVYENFGPDICKRGKMGNVTQTCINGISKISFSNAESVFVSNEFLARATPEQIRVEKIRLENEAMENEKLEILKQFENMSATRINEFVQLLNQLVGQRLDAK